MVWPRVLNWKPRSARKNDSLPKARKSCGSSASWVTTWRIFSPVRIEWRPLIQVTVSRNWRECWGRRFENRAGPGAVAKSFDGLHPQNAEHWKIGKLPPPPSESVCGRLKATPNSFSTVGRKVWFHVALNRWLRLGEGDIWSAATPYWVLVNESAMLYRRVSESLSPAR